MFPLLQFVSKTDTGCLCKISMAHHFNMVNICVQLFQIPLSSTRDMEWDIKSCALDPFIWHWIGRNMNYFKKKFKLWSGNNVWALTFIQASWNMRSANCFNMVNVCGKLLQNPSRGSRDMGRTHNIVIWSLTSNCDLEPSGSAHRLNMVNICDEIFKNPSVEWTVI